MNNKPVESSAERTDGARAARLPRIRGEKVWLRPPERTDIPLFVEWLNDAEVGHYVATRAPLSIPIEERWFDEMLERQGKDFFPFVICLLENDRPIGNSALHDMDRDNGNAGFGIFIGEPELWSRGYGTDALNAVLDFGFGEFRLERIWLDCYTFNPRGRRSYEKAGFRLEGTKRKAIFHRGQYHDVGHMAILREEWEALERPRTWELGTGTADQPPQPRPRRIR